MIEAEDTKQCPNCKLDILSTNYTIHYVHCQRNFYLCSKCEQPVNYEKRVEHDNINHVTVQCHSCQLELEHCHLDDHLINDCPNRKVKCQICDIEVQAVDLAEHEDYCGSRTEKCKECNEFVMLKYKGLHLDSNHTFIKLSDEPGPSPSWQNGRRTLCNFIPDLTSVSCKPASVGKRKSNECLRKDRNMGGPSESKNGSDGTYGKSLNFSGIEDESEAVDFKAITVKKSPKKDADEWPALAKLRSLQISEEKHENPINAKAGYSKQNGVDEDSDLLYAFKVSQEINSDIWSKEVSTEDEILKNCFKPLSENELSAGKSVDKNMFEKKMEDQEQPKFRNDFNYFYDKNESVKLPCEFCGDLIVSNDLILHQSRCGFYAMDNYNIRNTTYKMPYFDEDIEKKVACGICNKFFRLSLLENHQVHCQRNSSKSPKNQNFSKNLKAVNMKSERGLQNGLESSSPQLTRVGTRSEWLSQLSKSSEGGQDSRNNLNHPESTNVTKGTKVSRKSRRAPSPPTR